MSKEEGSDGAVELVGLPVAEAVDVVLAGDDSLDPGTVRSTLESIATDGVVSQAAVREALAEVATVVSTPETRIERAGVELSEARATAEAEGVTEIESVRTRLEEFEAHLEVVEEAIGSLGPELRELVDRRGDTGGAYEVAAGLRALRAEAVELRRAADELQQDLESFGRWLTVPEARYDEFESEVETVEESLTDLTGTVDTVAAAVGAAVVDDVEASANPGATWADAKLQTHVVGLLVTDLRADLTDLRTWPTTEGADEGEQGRLDELAEQLDELEDRRGSLVERVDELARASWTERFGAHVEEFEGRLAAFEPPVPWGEVEEVLQRHRDTLEG